MDLSQIFKHVNPDFESVKSVVLSRGISDNSKNLRFKRQKQRLQIWGFIELIGFENNTDSRISIDDDFLAICRGHRTLTRTQKQRKVVSFFLSFFLIPPGSYTKKRESRESLFWFVRKKKKNEAKRLFLFPVMRSWLCCHLFGFLFWDSIKEIEFYSVTFIIFYPV